MVQIEQPTTEPHLYTVMFFLLRSDKTDHYRIHTAATADDRLAAALSCLAKMSVVWFVYQELKTSRECFLIWSQLSDWFAAG